MHRAFFVCLAAACSSPKPPAAATPVASTPPLDAAPIDTECAPVDIYQQGARQIEVYCSHVADHCCDRQSFGNWNWICDNGNYIDWYGKYCAR